MCWLITYIRGLLLNLYIAASTALWGSLVVIDMLTFRSRNFVDKVLKTYWPRPILKMAGVEVEVRGSNKIPEGGFIYVFNHTSYVDIYALTAYLPKTPRFGAKIELFSIPILGAAMTAAGVLPIARHKRETVLKIYGEAEKRIDAGECFALAPEGTRQIGVELGKFKTGPFIFALNAKTKIVPIVLAGAGEVMPKGAWIMNKGKFKRKVILEILDPINSQNFNLENISDFQEAVRKQMAAAYYGLNKELGLVRFVN